MKRVLILLVMIGFILLGYYLSDPAKKIWNEIEQKARYDSRIAAVKKKIIDTYNTYCDKLQISRLGE